MAAAKTHYEILELTAEAKPIDIKKAYRRLALKHHPDRNGGSVESTEQFKLISEAYTILSNPNSRRSYDNELKFPTSTVSSPQSSAYQRSTYKDPFRQFDDLFTHDPFFHGAFEGMNDAFAARFNESHVNEQEKEDGWAFLSCGEKPKQQKKKQSWGEWILNTLGIEFNVTTYTKKSDGSMTKSAYASNASTGITNKQSRTYVDKQGHNVTVMSLQKHGNMMEDTFIAGKLVERKVNGVVEPLQLCVTNNTICS